MQSGVALRLPPHSKELCRRQTKRPGWQQANPAIRTTHCCVTR
jgi:hypothetical protein